MDGRRELTVWVTLLTAACGGLLSPRGTGIAAAEPMGEDSKALVQGNAEFALDLYAKLRTQEGNLALSPYSVSTALAMTYAGARGNTARQMADVLHFSLAPERLHPAFGAMVTADQASQGKRGYALHIANALWGQRGYGFLDAFLALEKEHYGAGLREVDFVGATEQARQTINAWTSDQTQHIIKELLRKDDLDAADVLVLTNAIYFKGSWASQFDKARTRDAPFHVGPDRQVTVPMMNQSRRLAFARMDKLSLLELPYEGDRLSMVLLLPTKIDGLAAVEKALNRKSLDKWLKRLREGPTLRVTLPRFKLGARFNLAETLEAMGMPDAFSGSNADFSGMTGKRDLCIGRVIHEARVDVNEEGTEAAAATAVTMKRTSMPLAFRADHPFLFLIRDKHSGSIVFMGRVADPKGQ